MTNEFLKFLCRHLPYNPKILNDHWPKTSIDLLLCCFISNIKIP